MREALATADSDFRPAPRARSSSRTTKSHASSWWQGSRGAKPGRQRLALVAGAILAIAIVGILANALLLQRTRHPAPLLGRAAPAPKPSPAQVSVRPPRPEVRTPTVAPDPPQAHERTAPDRPVTEAPNVPKPRQPAAASPTAVKPSDPIGDLLKVSPRESKPAVAVERRPEAPVAHRPAPAQVRPNVAKEPRPVAAIQPRPATTQANRATAAAQPNRRIAAAQRALVKLGFVLEADGVAGAATRKAIERYERDRGLPPRGVLSPELLRRLGSESGIPIE